MQIVVTSLLTESFALRLTLSGCPSSKTGPFQLSINCRHSARRCCMAALSGIDGMGVPVEVCGGYWHNRCKAVSSRTLRLFGFPPFSVRNILKSHNGKINKISFLLWENIGLGEGRRREFGWLNCVITIRIFFFVFFFPVCRMVMLLNKWE